MAGARTAVAAGACGRPDEHVRRGRAGRSPCDDPRRRHASSPIHRFKTHFALHGGPKYSPDGRFVYFASRDGWISKFDMWSLQTVAEVRAGINTRNLAVSSDGRYAMVANYLPHSLVLLDAARSAADQGDPGAWMTPGQSSRVSAVYDAGRDRVSLRRSRISPRSGRCSYRRRPRCRYTTGRCTTIAWARACHRQVGRFPGAAHQAR